MPRSLSRPPRRPPAAGLRSIRSGIISWILMAVICCLGMWWLSRVLTTNAARTGQPTFGSFTVVASSAALLMLAALIVCERIAAQVVAAGNAGYPRWDLSQRLRLLRNLLVILDVVFLLIAAAIVFFMPAADGPLGPDTGFVMMLYVFSLSPSILGIQGCNVILKIWPAPPTRPQV